MLFVELIRPTSGGHDQSTPLVDADLIRPGARSFRPRFSGASTTVGIMDTGFMVGDGAAVMHSDLSKFGCGINFTTDAAGVWDDEFGHGTHVLGTHRRHGHRPTSATGAWPRVWGPSAPSRSRAAKVWDRASAAACRVWMESAHGLHVGRVPLRQPGAPLVINLSGGARGAGLTGTDSHVAKARRQGLDRTARPTSSAAGNTGPGRQDDLEPRASRRTPSPWAT